MNSIILVKSINSFFKDQNRDIQKIYSEKISCISPKKVFLHISRLLPV